MHSATRSRLHRLAAAVLCGAGLLASSTANAFPWDWDMVDAEFYKAYEWAMMSLPDGAVTMNHYVRNGDRMTPQGQAIKNPLTSPTNTDIVVGQRMFSIYCQACHGVEGKGGAPVTKNDPANGIKRYPIPPPMLSGPGAITAVRSDGYIYLTIRNGGAIMPRYASQLDDSEMWAIVTYIRTLDGATFAAPPEPAENQ
ncbi:MAG: cytochrome c [Oligoflexia bacterium]|nr:cytochrome c [Oligoflexia bacterium]